MEYEEYEDEDSEDFEVMDVCEDAIIDIIKESFEIQGLPMTPSIEKIIEDEFVMMNIRISYKVGVHNN